MWYDERKAMELGTKIGFPVVKCKRCGKWRYYLQKGEVLDKRTKKIFVDCLGGDMTCQCE